MSIQLTPELIEYAVNNFPKEVISECDTVSANHILFNEFHIKYPNYPKLIFYIVMDKIFGQSYLKDEKGNLGRKLKVINQ